MLHFLACGLDGATELSEPVDALLPEARWVWTGREWLLLPADVHALWMQARRVPQPLAALRDLVPSDLWPEFFGHGQRARLWVDWPWYRDPDAQEGTQLHIAIQPGFTHPWPKLLSRRIWDRPVSVARLQVALQRALDRDAWVTRAWLAQHLVEDVISQPHYLLWGRIGLSEPIPTRPRP